MPLGFAAAKGVVSPFLSNIIAQINPEGLARRQVARAIVESGEAPDEIARALQQARVEGQGNFTVADALGNAGQRMLSTVARAPGEGRTAAVNFLENRQAGQGRRVRNALAEGFDAPETAAQAESRLTQARNGMRADLYTLASFDFSFASRFSKTRLLTGGTFLFLREPELGRTTPASHPRCL